MPPKKKKSGKKKKSAKDGSGSSSPTKATSGGELDQLSKEYYLIQIKDLEQRLVRYQKKCDELEVANGEFHKKFEQMATDKKDIVSFWKRQMEQRTDEIADLNDRLVGLQQAKDAEKDKYETQLQQLRAEFTETKDQLTADNMILGGKLASLEEFKVQKEDLMAKFAAQEEQLKQKEVEHNEVIYGLEKKAVIDKDRLKKEMVVRVNQVASEFRKVSNKQMAETTKRTIRENVSINSQMTKMSDKTMDLIQENDEHRDKEKKQRQKIELLEVTEKELARKNHSNQKIIRMLTEKCRNQEEIIAEFEGREEEYEDMEMESESLKQQTDSLRGDLEDTQKNEVSLSTQLEEMQSVLSQEKQDRFKVERILIDAAASLRLTLRKTAPDEETDSANDIETRDHMLENLLVLLNSAAAIGVGPQPADLGKQFDIRSVTKMPGSGKGIRKGEFPMSLLADSNNPIPHYQLGDLGLIPRPKQHIPSSMDKVKAGLSEASRLGGMRKVLSKSVAIQTASVPKAMFYADQLVTKPSHSTQKPVPQIPPGRTTEVKSPLLAPILITKNISSKVF